MHLAPRNECSGENYRSGTKLGYRRRALPTHDILVRERAVKAAKKVAVVAAGARSVGDSVGRPLLSSSPGRLGFSSPVARARRTSVYRCSLLVQARLLRVLPPLAALQCFSFSFMTRINNERETTIKIQNWYVCITSLRLDVLAGQQGMAREGRGRQPGDMSWQSRNR